MTATPLAEAYPLHWPKNKKRTTQPAHSRFKTTFAVARDQLFHELKRIGARSTVLSTNVSLRQDGLPYAGQKNPADAGVAVYFYRKDKPLCFCCDRWKRVEDNIWAVVKTIEAIRGIERWGSGEALEAAFTGFQALPAPPPAETRAWWVVLGVMYNEDNELVQNAYFELCRQYHPDRNIGRDTTRQMQEVNRAYEDFKQARGLK